MQSNNSNSLEFNIANKNMVKNVIMTFLPILFLIVIEVLVNIVDTIILFISNIVALDSTGNKTNSQVMAEAYNQPINQANMVLARFIICGILFGIMYYKLIYLPTQKQDYTLKDILKSNLLKLNILLLIVIGYCSQLITDVALTFIRPHFPKLFSDYDSMTSSVNGVTASVNMIIAVTLIAPIAEELLFRGLIMNYASQYMKKPIALIFQALIFGLYHGNVIQFAYATILGLLIGAVFYKTNSILPCIALHIFINTSLYFIPNVFLIDNINCIISLVIASVLIVIALYLFFKKSTKN